MKRLCGYFLSACLFVGCNPTNLEMRDSPHVGYEPATEDYGVVLRAYDYNGWSYVHPIDGAKLVAAEIEFPPTEAKFDLDDVDIFDADTGLNYGSDPQIQRLTPDGALVDVDDPDVINLPEFRGIFVWAVPRETKRVNFGYWGGMLFREPFDLQPSGPVLPEPAVRVKSISLVSLNRGGYDIYHVVIEADNWSRVEGPSSYSLLGFRDGDKVIASMDAWLETDQGLKARPMSIEQRPYYIKKRWFVAEFWAPTGITPEKLNYFGNTWPLPKETQNTLPEATIEALSEAPRREFALHRLKDQA